MNRNFLLISVVAVAALGSTACQQLKARDNLNKGVQAYKNSKFPEAIGFFQKAVELDPDLSEAHNSLGGVWLESGDLQRNDDVGSFPTWINLLDCPKLPDP